MARIVSLIVLAALAFAAQGLLPLQTVAARPSSPSGGPDASERDRQAFANQLDRWLAGRA